MDKLSKPQGIIIHHSTTRDTESISFEAIKKFHKGKGWDNIGYHYLIERVQGLPVLYTGRGLQYYGAHCFGKNNYIGICVVGDYDDLRTPIFTDGKIDLLVNLLVGLLFIYPYLTTDDIHYHREYSNKTCPGVYFPALKKIKEIVLSRVLPINFIKEGNL